jgi:hypothetical protein
MGFMGATMKFEAPYADKPEMTVVYGVLGLYSAAIGFLIGLAF